MNEPEYEPDFKCATFDKSGITPEIRAKMDADRRRAEEERDKQDGQSVAGTPGVESAPVGSSAWLGPESRGWLVEKGPAHAPDYLTVENGEWDWTKSHIEALRFARKLDADAVASLIGEEVERIAEHSWA